MPIATTSAPGVSMKLPSATGGNPTEVCSAPPNVSASPSKHWATLFENGSKVTQISQIAQIIDWLLLYKHRKEGENGRRLRAQCPVSTAGKYAGPIPAENRTSCGKSVRPQNDYNWDDLYFLRQQFSAAIEAAHFPAETTRPLGPRLSAIFTILYTQNSRKTSRFPRTRPTGATPQTFQTFQTYPLSV